MTTLKQNGVEIDLSFDKDGFPCIAIQLHGAVDGIWRPSAEVRINGVTIHEMFNHDEPDYRWALNKQELAAAREAVGNDEYGEPDILRAVSRWQSVSTDALRVKLKAAEEKFKDAGGRGVSLADEIDVLRVVIAIRNVNGD
jgi:hypothetical protein